MTNAYREGYLAFPDKNCAYEEGTVEYHNWWDGYTQAELVSAYYNDDAEDWIYL